LETRRVCSQCTSNAYLQDLTTSFCELVLAVRVTTSLIMPVAASGFYEGTRLLLLGMPIAKFARRPLKVVYIGEKGGYVVLSVYLLKRSYRRPER
jgi:hypothetical protein